jgi:phenylacetate-CoA ligase
VRSLDEFRSLPLMRKEDVVADVTANPPFGSISSTSPADVAQFVETTGTTRGGREQYVLSREDDSGLLEMESIGFFWAGVNPGDFVATAFPVTTRGAGRWHQSAVNRLGGVYLPIGTYPTEKKLEYLRDLPVSMLVATPSYLMRLEHAAREMSVDPAASGVRALLVAGEAFPLKWGVEREGVWQARLFEQYGSTQRAFAWSCETGAVPDGTRGVLHTLPHLACYEVIDVDTGAHVEPGVRGELVITPFAASRAAPLVRFATGDRVRWLGEDACSCGRAFAGIESGEIDRLDDMIKVRGVNLFPSQLDSIILSAAIVDYQGVVDIDEQGRERIRVSVQLRPEASASRDWLERLAHELRRTTGLRFELSLHEGPPLTPETSEEMRKRRRWIDSRLT